MRPGKSLRSPRENESARRDTRALQAGATNCTGGREPPLVEAKMGEPAGTGDCMEILAGPRKGGDGAAPKEVLTPDVGLEEFPNLLTPPARSATWLRPWRGRNGAKRSCRARCLR